MKKFIVLLSLVITASAMASSDFSCGGTEPFWDLTVKDNIVTYNAFLADESMKVEEVTSRVGATNTQEDFAFVIKTETMISSILAGECNDGMSDNVYSHSIILSSGNNVVTGCCNKIK